VFERFSSQDVELCLWWTEIILSLPQILPTEPMKYTLLALSLLFLAAAERGFAIAEADTVGPTITITSPAIGAVLKNEKIVVAGTSKDNKQDPTPSAAGGTANTVTLAGVKYVQYRFAGEKRWRQAILIPGTATTTTTGTGATAVTTTTTGDPTWVFQFKSRRGQSQRVSIRGIDNNGNEGDIITINLKRSRA
jgi:hypothetical protein